MIQIALQNRARRIAVTKDALQRVRRQHRARGVVSLRQHELFHVDEKEGAVAPAPDAVEFLVACLTDPGADAGEADWLAPGVAVEMLTSSTASDLG